MRRTITVVLLAGALSVLTSLGFPARISGAPPVNQNGVIGATWLAHRADLGDALTLETCRAQGTECWQRFDRGAITWSKESGAQVVSHPAIYRLYQQLAGIHGVLGVALAPALGDLPGDGVTQQFEDGQIFWSATTGAHTVSGPVLQHYLASGAAYGEFGYPITEQSQVPGGVEQRFQNGNLYLAAETGRLTSTTPGYLKTRYEELGGPEGELGIPVGDKTPAHGGFYQEFSRGALLWSQSTGAWTMTREALHTWLERAGDLGFATSDRHTDERGVHNVFERGEVITQNGQVYSAETIGPQTAILLCDSQCDANSWSEQGLRANGFTQIIERTYGGGGYHAVAPGLGTSQTVALTGGKILLPQGQPGLILVTLGGNDASQGASDTEITAGMDEFIAKLRALYPDTRIIVNGVMSRDDAAHVRRRAVDALVTGHAQRLGLTAISVAGWASRYNAPYDDNVHLSSRGHDVIAVPYGQALGRALGG